MMSQFEKGQAFLQAGKSDAAWCAFYKALQEVEYQMKGTDASSQQFLKFQLLVEIGNIQQEKFYHEAAKASFEEAEEIRLTHLKDFHLEPLKQIGLFKWHEDLKVMEGLEIDEHYYALLAMGPEVIADIEAVDDALKTDEHWQLLLDISEIMYRSYLAIDEADKAKAYQEKAEDLVFLHDL